MVAQTEHNGGNGVLSYACIYHREIIGVAQIGCFACECEYYRMFVKSA